jgi:hypothetical protein
MPHPFSLMDWLYCDQVGHALASTADNIPEWTAWARQLVEQQKVRSRSPTAGYPQLERVGLIAYCKSNNIPPRRLDPSWTDEQSAPFALTGETGLERLMQIAKIEFYSTYSEDEPNTAPRSVEVVKWLMEQGASQREARAIDLIIRPEPAKRGGRHKSRD